MRGDQDGHLEILLQIFQAVPHGMPCDGIKANCRFIEKHNRRPVKHRLREFQPPNHSARISFHQACRDSVSPINSSASAIRAFRSEGACHRVSRRASNFPLRSTRHLRTAFAAHSQFASVPPQGFHHIESCDHRHASSRLQQRGQHLDRGAFSRAVRPQQSKNLAEGNVHINVVNRSYFAEGPRERDGLNRARLRRWISLYGRFQCAPVPRARMMP